MVPCMSQRLKNSSVSLSFVFFPFYTYYHLFISPFPFFSIHSRFPNFSISSKGAPLGSLMVQEIKKSLLLLPIAIILDQSLWLQNLRNLPGQSKQPKETDPNTLWKWALVQDLFFFKHLFQSVVPVDYLKTNKKGSPNPHTFSRLSVDVDFS